MYTDARHTTVAWTIAVLMVFGTGLVPVHSSTGENWSPVTQSTSILIAKGDPEEEEDWSTGLRTQGILFADDASEEEEEEDWTLG